MNQEDQDCWPPNVLLNFLAERLRLQFSQKHQALELQIKLPDAKGDAYWSSVSVAYLED